MSYTYTKVDELEKTTMVGNHQCVALVRHCAGAPAIATFVNGKYAYHQQGNHAAR